MSKTTRSLALSIVLSSLTLVPFTSNAQETTMRLNDAVKLTLMYSNDPMGEVNVATVLRGKLVQLTDEWVEIHQDGKGTTRVPNHNIYSIWQADEE